MTTWARVTILSKGGKEVISFLGNPDGYPSFVIPHLKRGLSRYRGQSITRYAEAVNNAVRETQQVGRKGFGLKPVPKSDRWFRQDLGGDVDYTYIVDLKKRLVSEVRP